MPASHEPAALVVSTASAPLLDFLRNRIAAAILTGDDLTATRLIGELDRLLNEAAP